MQRSMLLFENAIKTQATREKYKYHLNKFLKFTKLKDYDSLISLDTNTIQMLLENYVFHLKDKGLSGKSIRGYMPAIELFFDINKKSYYKEILHRLYPLVERPGGELPYTTQDIQKMLSNTTSKRLKSLIHFLASTGSRPASIDDPVLRFKHVKAMPFACKAIQIYAGSKDEYWGFLTPEASRSLDDYRNERIRHGEEINQESPIFRISYKIGSAKVKHWTKGSAVQAMYNVVGNTEIDRIKVGTRFDKAINYGFRKRFNTILKLKNNVNSNIAEKLMAHSRGYDGSYLKPTIDECFAEFVKAIPELTIDDNERLKLQSKIKDETIKKMESEKDIRITNLENKLSVIEKLLNQAEKGQKV